MDKTRRGDDLGTIDPTWNGGRIKLAIREPKNVTTPGGSDRMIGSVASLSGGPESSLATDRPEDHDSFTPSTHRKNCEGGIPRHRIFELTTSSSQ